MIEEETLRPGSISRASSNAGTGTVGGFTDNELPNEHNIDSNLRREAVSKIKKSDVFQHLSRCASIIAGYAATALIFGSALALGLTPIGWAAIGVAALIMLIAFIALRRQAQNKEGVQTDTLLELRANTGAIIFWPLYIIKELAAFFSLFKKDADPAAGPSMVSERGSEAEPHIVDFTPSFFAQVPPEPFVGEKPSDIIAPVMTVTVAGGVSGQVVSDKKSGNGNPPDL